MGGAAVGSWKRVSKVGDVDDIEFAVVVYIQADQFCSEGFGCVVFGGGTLSINRDGGMEGEIGFSFRLADDDTAPTSHFGIFPMYLQKRSIEEIRSLATPPTP